MAKTGEKPDSSTTTKKAEKAEPAEDRNSKEIATSAREKNPN